MRRLRPVDPPASAPDRLEEKAPARRRVPEVGAVEDAPFDLVVARFDRRQPRTEAIALARLERAPARAERPPFDELRDVLDDEPPDEKLVEPGEDQFRLRPELVAPRLSALCARVVRAARRRPEEVDAPARHEVGRDRLLDRHLQRVDVRVILAHRVDGDLPMVDGDAPVPESELAQRQLEPGRRAAGPAEEVDRVDLTLFLHAAPLRSRSSAARRSSVGSSSTKRPRAGLRAHPARTRPETSFERPPGAIRPRVALRTRARTSAS